MARSGFSDGTLLAASFREDAMKANRFWIEIVVFATGMAFALALLIATLGAGAVAVAGHESSRTESRPTESGLPASGQARDASSPRQQTHEGMVTCSRCGAKHSADLGKTAGGCVRQCVQSGASFSLVDGETTYMLDGDLQVLQKVAGQRARVMGPLRGNTIKVSSVVAAS